MKKLVAILLIVVMVLGLAACGSGSSDSRLDQIKDKGYIEICTEPYFAPYEFIDPSKEGDDQYLGMDIKLMQAIADEIGVDLRIVPLEFDAVLSGVTSGKYDMAISAIAYSPAREEAMKLSRGYYFEDTGYGLIVREGDEDKYNSIESLKDAVVITQSGSVQEGIYNMYVAESGCKEFKRTSVMTDSYLAVAQGKADACICSTESAQLYADANGGLVIPEFRFDVDPEMNGIVAAAPLEGSDELMEVVNSVITKLLEKNQLEAWFQEGAEQAKTLGIE